MADMDLSCSESSADLSAEFESPRLGSGGSGAPCTREYRLLDAQEAREEVARLVEHQGRSAVPLGGLEAAGISPELRNGMVGQLIEVAKCIDNVDFSTIALAVSLLDRYLAVSSGFNTTYAYMRRLVTVVCLSIASKVEEVYNPPGHLELYMRATGCVPEAGQPPQLTERELLRHLNQTEVHVLNALGWRVLAVTPAGLLEPLLCLVELPLLAGGGDAAACYKALYQLEQGCRAVLTKCMGSAAFLRFSPATLAAAAMVLSLQGMGAAAGGDLLPAAKSVWQALGQAAALQVPAARDLMQQELGAVPPPACSACELEVEATAGSVRVHRQAAGSATPRSVLRNAPSLQPLRSPLPPATLPQLHCFELLGDADLLASPMRC